MMAAPRPKQLIDHFDAKHLIPIAQIQAIKSRLIQRLRERLRRDNVSGCAAAGRMPTPTNGLVGRDEDIAQLIDLMRAHRTVSIEGPGGIGKTQLLLHALQRMSEEAVLWIEVEPDSTAHNLELSIHNALTSSGVQLLTESILDALSSLKIRIVFDGIEQLALLNRDALHDLLHSLITKTTGPSFVFTSQVELIGLDIGARFPVAPLTHESSFLVLRASTDPAQQEAPETERSLKQLAAFCDGHPLSLKLAAGLIQYFKSPSVAIKRIHQHGTSALQNPTRETQTARTSLRACLMVSFSALTPDQRRLLCLASQFPAGCLVLCLESPGQYNIQDPEEQIATLQHWHLMDVRADAAGCPRLHVLSPIRTFVHEEMKSRAPAELQDLRNAFVRDMTFLAMVIDSHHMQTGNVAWGVFRFSQELPNIYRAFEIALQEPSQDAAFLEFVSAIASSLMVFCFVRGLFMRGRKIMRLGADAALRLGRKEAASNLLIQLLTLSSRSQDTDAVRTVAAELTGLAANSTEPRVQANAEIAKSEIAMLEGRFDAAATHASAAEAAYEAASQAPNLAESLTTPHSQACGEGQTDSNQQMMALALKQRAFALEKAGRPRDALPVLRHAYEVAHRSDDSINTGSILHHIGNCSADIRQFPEAFAAYIAAATQFRDACMVDYLSNSLCDAGYLLIEWDPPPSSLVGFPEELIADGLDDVNALLRADMTSQSPELNAEVCSQLIRKAFGLMALATFASHNGLLATWASDLREKVLIPLVDQLHERGSMDRILIMHLDLTLALAVSVSTVEQKNGCGSKPDVAELHRYASICFKYWEPGWRAFRPFEWLTTWLRRHRGTTINKEVLLEAITATEERGAAFVLPNIPANPNAFRK